MRAGEEVPLMSISSGESHSSSEPLPPSLWMAFLQKVLKLLYDFWQIFKRISITAFPRALSYTYSFSVLFIMLILTKLGITINDIDAIVLIAAMMYTAMPLGICSLFSMSVKTSKLHGEASLITDEVSLAEKREEISTVYLSGLGMASILTPLTMLPFLFSEWLFITVFRQNAQTSQIAHNFLRIIAFTVPSDMLRVATEQMMLSLGYESWTMSLALVCFAIGVFISSWLGLGGFGFKSYGAEGVAIGSLFTSYLTACAFSLFIGLHPKLRPYKFFNFSNKVVRATKQLIELAKIGFSIFLSMIAELSLPLVMGALAGILGTVPQATWNFAMQLVFFIFLFAVAFGQQCAQDLNNEIGKKNYTKASHVGIFGLITSLLYLATATILIGIFPNSLTFLLNVDNNDIRSMLPSLMLFVTPAVCLQIIESNLICQSRPLGIGYSSAFVSSIGLLFGMLVAAFFSLYTDMGINAVGLGLLSGFLFATTGLFIMWIKQIQPQKLQQMNEAILNAPSLSKNSRFRFLPRDNTNTSSSWSLADVASDPQSISSILEENIVRIQNV